MARYRIHFTDNYGQGTIEQDTLEEFKEALKNLRENPEVEDIWTETYDEETGWEA